MIRSKVFETSKGKVDMTERLTICEAHRQIYDILFLNFQDKPDFLRKLFPLLEGAFISGISMNLKLIEYKLSNEDAFLDHSLSDSVEAKTLRTERNRLFELKERLESQRRK